MKKKNFNLELEIFQQYDKNIHILSAVRQKKKFKTLTMNYINVPFNNYRMWDSDKGCIIGKSWLVLTVCTNMVLPVLRVLLAWGVVATWVVRCCRGQEVWIRGVVVNSSITAVGQWIVHTYRGCQTTLYNMRYTNLTNVSLKK